MLAMSQRRPHSLISGARITSLGTLVSRVLGMLRDMATAALFGMSRGGVMDAFVIALRLPNTFRRLFGEGALAASYLPVLAAEWEKSPAYAWRLASAMFVWLGAALAGLLAILVAGCALVWLMWPETPGMGLLVGLTAVMLPYMPLICLAAQVAATLHVRSRFAVPALAPALLNVCWLFGVWVLAPLVSDPHAQAYVVAVCVLAAGVLQLGVQLAVLPRLGFRFEYDWAASRSAALQIVRAWLPMTLGLAITQVNTLLDSLIAWGLAAGPEGPDRIAWLGAVRYPLSQGAAASIYYGERLYEFPLALVGIAVATAIYPLLSRHAARGDRAALGGDLTLGLRTVLFWGVPATAGLLMLAEPLARLLYQHGHFTAEDTARAARVIACYAAGVWAYCASPVIVRAYYALGDRATPVKVGAGMVGLNLLLNLSLVWPLAEAGLAVSTAVSGSVQLGLLLVLFSRHRTALDWRWLAAGAGRTLTAAAAMTAVVWIGLARIAPGPSLANQVLRVSLPAALGAAVYFGAYALLGAPGVPRRPEAK